jgi:small subunit ribosomal protein S21
MAKEKTRSVSVKKGESVDRALKRLKSKLDAEGILEEMRRRRAFESPAERKRRKARTAPKRYRARWRYVSESQERAEAAAKEGS